MKKYLREDLFYRFSSGVVSIPPLRNRPGDIDLYLDHFLDQYSKNAGHYVSGYSTRLRSLLNSYTWPGNVRELIHIVSFMIHNGEGHMLTIADLPAYMLEAVQDSGQIESGGALEPESLAHSYVVTDDGSIDLNLSVEQLERRLIEHSLAKYHGNIIQTSRYLNLSRQTLTYKMHRLGISRSKFKDMYDKK